MTSSSTVSSDRRLPPPPKYDSSVASEVLAVVLGVMGSLTVRTATSYLSNYSLEGASQSSSSSSTPPPFWLRDVCAAKSPFDENEEVCSTLTSAAATAAFGVWNAFGIFGSILARILIWFLPHTQATNNKNDDVSTDIHIVAVGFSLANVWVLLWIRQRWRCYAHLPTRLCETIMGRLSWRRFFFVVLPIHLIGTMLIVWSCQELLMQISKMSSSIPSFASSWSHMALAPVVYSSKTLWWMLLLNECLVTTMFIVSLLVVPELLRVNRLPVWPCGLVMLKLYSYGLDAGRQPSTLQPVLLVVFSWLAAMKEQQLNAWKLNFEWIIVILPNLVGSMLGGWVAGCIMRKCFPDAPAIRR